MAMSICTGLKPQAGDGMGEKKERGRFTLRFNEGDPIHEAAIGLLELQSPRRSEERRVGKECRSRWSPYH